MRHYLQDHGVRASILAGIGLGAAYVAVPSPYIAGMGVAWGALAVWSLIQAQGKADK